MAQNITTVVSIYYPGRLKLDQFSQRDIQFFVRVDQLHVYVIIIFPLTKPNQSSRYVGSYSTIYIGCPQLFTY